MQKWLSRIFNRSAYTTPLERRQAMAAYIMILLALGGTTLGFLFQPGRTYDSLLVQISLAALLGLVVIWWLVASGRLGPARWILLLLAAGGMMTPAIASGLTLSRVMLQAAFLVTSTLLAAERGVIAGGVFALLVNAAIVLNAAQIDASRADMIRQEALVTAAFAVTLAGLLYVLAEGWQRGLSYLGEGAAQRRLRMVELSAEVSQRIFQRTELETLLADTVELIRDQFDDIYHAQIFLNNRTNEFAVLQASTGPAGQELLRRNHRLAIGGQSVIGKVTTGTEPVIVRDTHLESVHRRNELLPSTRTELALPLISGNTVIGALDVQSLTPNAFTPDDISTLQTLANQIAVAIDNARLFNEQQEVIQQNQRLVEQAHQQVQQIQDLNRRLTRHAWGNYLTEQDLLPALTVDFTNEVMTPNAEWTSSLDAAARSGRLANSVSEDGSKKVLSVPLNVRGQIVGAMEFELEGDSTTDDDAEALVQDVANRLALSLESARLYEEAQRLAQREAVINDISARMQEASGLENTLTMAAQGLQTALNAPRVAIRLGAPPTDEANGSGANGQEVDA